MALTQHATAQDDAATSLLCDTHINASKHHFTCALFTSVKLPAWLYFWKFIMAINTISRRACWYPCARETACWRHDMGVAPWEDVWIHASHASLSVWKPLLLTISSIWKISSLIAAMSISRHLATFVSSLTRSQALMLLESGAWTRSCHITSYGNIWECDLITLSSRHMTSRESVALSRSYHICQYHVAPYMVISHYTLSSVAWSRPYHITLVPYAI